MEQVYDYIEAFWKKSAKELENEPFDLEECFTLLEAQFNDALAKGQTEDARNLSNIRFTLKSFVAELLSEFELEARTSARMHQFGELLWAEKPTILSFNYDTIIESVLESASGFSDWILSGKAYPQRDPGEPIPDDELAFSHSKWNRPLGYGIKFDRV